MTTMTQPIPTTDSTTESEKLVFTLDDLKSRQKVETQLKDVKKCDEDV